MNKTVITGIILFALGITSGVLEKIFYGGHLDENNTVQESFFLPLSIFLILLGIVTVIIGATLNLLKK